VALATAAEVGVLAPGDAVSGAALDAPELVDVDVDQLAGMAALVAVRRLRWLQPRQLAQPDPRQDARHRGERHREHLGDLRPGHAQPPQRGDRLHAVLAGSRRLARRRRRAIAQARLALGPVAAHPLAGGADAHFGGLGRLRERPLLLDDALAEHQALLQAERRVSVQHHPVPSLGLSWLDTAQPPRRPG
jgi:hypothetical protein